MKAYIQAGRIRLMPESQLESDELAKLMHAEKREIRGGGIVNPEIKDYPWRMRGSITTIDIFYQNEAEVCFGS